MINKKKFSKIQKILIILFILYPFNCFADYNWKKIGSTTRGDVGYVDLSSIKKVGNEAYYFELLDYVKPTNQGHLSDRAYNQLNCLNLSYRYLKNFFYLEPMANGKVDLINDEVSEWYDTKEGSLGEKIRQFVCNY